MNKKIIISIFAFLIIASAFVLSQAGCWECDKIDEVWNDKGRILLNIIPPKNYFDPTIGDAGDWVQTSKYITKPRTEVPSLAKCREDLDGVCTDASDCAEQTKRTKKAEIATDCSQKTGFICCIEPGKGKECKAEGGFCTSDTISCIDQHDKGKLDCANNQICCLIKETPTFGFA